MFVICLQRDFYTLAELQKVPPPQGVDPAKLEAYLSDSTFQVRLAVCTFVRCVDGSAIRTTRCKVQHLYHQPGMIEYSTAYHFQILSPLSSFPNFGSVMTAATSSQR